MRWQTGETRHAVLWLSGDDDLPAIGLTPTVVVRRVSDGTVITPPPTVVEVGDGFYRLSFTAPAAGSYAFLVNAGETLDAAHRFVPLEVPVGGFVDLLDISVSTRATPADVTASRDSILTQVGTPSQVAALAALQAAVTALGAPAQASAYTPARAALLDALALLDAAVSTRATPADVTTAGSYEGSLT